MECSCETKIQFEIDGGSIYNSKPLEENTCMAFNECLDCIEIEEELEDGLYTADLSCKIYKIGNPLDGFDYDGTSTLENIKMIR